MDNNFLKIILIGTGGFTGAILRYLLSGWVQYRSGSITFPFGTMAVNLIGCAFIGLLTFLVDHRSALSVEMRAFLLVGFLGSFTTFSTFGNETMNLLRDGRMDLAVFNVGGQVLAGIILVWVGRAIASFIWR